jgi:non-ribosomal peptide synthetase component F
MQLHTDLTIGAYFDRKVAEAPDHEFVVYPDRDLRWTYRQFDERVDQLKRSLPASLSLSRLRRATAELVRLEEQGALQNVSANGDGAKALVLRLGRAVDELELLLREVQPSAV